MQPAERKRPGMRALFGSMALGLFASSSNGSKVVKGGIKDVLPVLILKKDNTRNPPLGRFRVFFACYVTIRLSRPDAGAYPVPASAHR